MDNIFTKENIKKAFEQADANIGFEEINMESLEKRNKPKTLVKELKYGQTNGSNQLGTISNTWDRNTKK